MKFIFILSLALIVRTYFVWPLSRANAESDFAKLKQFAEWRSYLADRIDTIMPAPQSSLLSGVLLGEQKDFSKELKKALTNSSTIHIAVVSGQNLSLLGGLLLGLSGWIGRKRAILATVAACLLYAFLTGFELPVFRAWLMLAFTLAAQFFNREAQAQVVLFEVLLVMLILNPNWIFSISFILSGLATFGVVVVAPLFEKVLRSLPSFLRADLATSLSVQLLLMPVIASVFHQFSLIGVLANLLVLWTIPLIMVSGIVALCFGLVNSFLGTIAGLVPAVLLTYFIDITYYLGSLPFSSLKMGELNLVVWVGYYLLVAGFVINLYHALPPTET